MKRFTIGFILSALLLPGSGACDKFFREGLPQFAAGEAASRVAAMPDFTELARALSPSVVNIAVEAAPDSDTEGESDESPLPGFPFFKKEKEVPSNSLGSGFVVHEDGYIVTNNHVVRDSKRIVVRLLDDKTEYEAQVVGRDLMTDLALLKIEAQNKLPAVYFGDSDEVEVGQWVMAIGNQFQLGQTITSGIVSAKSRRPRNLGQDHPYDAYIQTDASINPGSSGGPLFNTRGQVVGINTAIFSPGRAPQLGGTGFNIGIGFAIPINLAKSVIQQLKSKGRVTRGLLGVLIQEVTVDVAQALSLDSPYGALVSDVKKDSPAEQAGFRRGDVILTYEGARIKNHDELPLLVANTKIGTDVKVEVLRSGDRITLIPRVGELKARETPAAVKEKPKPNEIGLVLRDLTEEEARKLGLQLKSGAAIDFVAPDSPAQKAGLLKNDVIEEFSRQLVTDAASFERILKTIPRDKPVMVLVRRQEGTFYQAIRLK